MSERDIHAEAIINGKKSGGLSADITASVQQSLFLPCMIRVEIPIPRHEAESVVKKALNDWLGGTLVLRVWDDSRPGVEKNFQGTIVSLASTVHGIEAIAQSEDHLLGSARKYRSYAGMAVRDIVQEVVTRAGIHQYDIIPPADSLRFKFMHQYDETDQEFLRRLARYDGAVFYHDGEKFVYEPEMGNRTTVTLELSESESLDVALHCDLLPVKAHGIPYDFVHHVDPASAEVKSPSPAPPCGTFGAAVSKKAGTLFQNAVTDLFEEPVVDKPNFEALLKHQQKLNAGRLVRVSGHADEPAVAIGRSLQCPTHPLLAEPVVVVDLKATWIGNVYTAQFEAIPPKSAVQGAGPDLRRHLGLLEPARVRDNKDPEKLGRVQIQYLWDLDGRNLAWARLVQAGAGKTGGKTHGTHFTPRIGDQVLAGCIHGDPSLPVVFGALYHSESKPDFRTENGTEEVLVVQTPAQSTVRVLDNKGAEEILIAMRDNKNLIRLELKGPKITVESAGGTVVVHSSHVKIRADTKLEIQAQEIDITADKNMTTHVGQDANLTVGRNRDVRVNANSEETVAMDKTVMAFNNLKLSAGINADTEAGTCATVKAGVVATVEAAQVETKATATNTIKGALVMIN